MQIMKLSEAIRLGAMLRPQAFGHTYERPHDMSSPSDILKLNQTPAKTCAIAAALEAVNRLNPMSLYADTRSLFPILTQIVKIPEDGYIKSEVGLLEAIVCLNDLHRWGRQRIADWVEQIELQQQPYSHAEQRSVSDSQEAVLQTVTV